MRHGIGAALALSAVAALTAPAAASASAQGSAVVRTEALRQPIVGFGASGAFGMAGQIRTLPAKLRTRVLNLLFSTKVGAGLSAVRSLVNDGIDGQTIEPSPGVWTWNITPDDQIWLMHQAQRYGVKTFMATPWSAPAWMKRNDSVTGGTGDTTNYLLPKYYHAYAVYLANFVNGYAKHFHIHFSAISVQNEPNMNVTYASMIWTPQEFATFIQNDLGPVFKAKHVTAKVMMPEQSFWGEQYANPTLKDPKASAVVSIVAAHDYGPQPIVPLTLAEQEHKQVWMTEASTFSPDDPSIQNGLKWAVTIDQFLVDAHVNEWNYWWLAANSGDNEGLISLTPSGITVNKRLYTMGNFSRFVRPGYRRISATKTPAPGINLAAFKDPKSGRLVVVLINDTESPATVPVRLNPTPAGLHAMTPYVTSAAKNLAPGAPVPIAGGSFTAHLPAQSVTTYVGP